MSGEIRKMTSSLFKESSESLVLNVIRENQPISISQLADKLGISGGTTIYRRITPLVKSKKIILIKSEEVRGKPVFISIHKTRDNNNGNTKK